MVVACTSLPVKEAKLHVHVPGSTQLTADNVQYQYVQLPFRFC